MRRAWRHIAMALGLGLVLTLAAAAALAMAALQGEPRVVRSGDINADDIGKVLDLARAHDPRHLPPGQVTTLQLSERDVDALLNQAARRWLQGASRLTMQDKSASLLLSLRAPVGPWQRWLNVELNLQETASLPWVTALQVGGLSLPPRLGTWLGKAALERAGLSAELNLAVDLIKKVDFAPKRLSLSYVLNPDDARRMLTSLLPAGEEQRLHVYSDRLVTLAKGRPPFAEVSLAQWLGPMFELARQRSAAGADAALENRSAILALTLYVNGRGVGSLFPDARQWTQPAPLVVTLYGRSDFPQHLLISAALAMEGSGPLSKAIGVWKELADSRGGSGFSFNDIAADRAGTRLGELALSQPRKVQERLALGVQDSDLMPAWTDLPEFLPEPEFKRRFGGIGAPPYLALIAEIDRRVGALPVLR